MAIKLTSTFFFIRPDRSCLTNLSRSRSMWFVDSERNQRSVTIQQCPAPASTKVPMWHPQQPPVIVISLYKQLDKYAHTNEWVIKFKFEFYVPLDTKQVISDSSLSRQSLAPILTTQNKQEKTDQKHKKIKNGPRQEKHKKHRENRKLNV